MSRIALVLAFVGFTALLASQVETPPVGAQEPAKGKAKEKAKEKAKAQWHLL